ncbi:hypothetical protein KKI24_12865 [bacterium]|nr:hypothetical protein [bacterium]
MSDVFLPAFSGNNLQRTIIRHFRIGEEPSGLPSAPCPFEMIVDALGL